MIILSIVECVAIVHNYALFLLHFSNKNTLIKLIIGIYSICGWLENARFEIIYPITP